MKSPSPAIRYLSRKSFAVRRDNRSRMGAFLMDITRNQYFLAGLVLLYLGIELLSVASFMLTPEFTMYLAKQTNHPIASLNTATESLVPDAGSAVPPKTIVHPEWIGWSLVSLGSVLVLHSWAMKKPGG